MINDRRDNLKSGKDEYEKRDEKSKKQKGQYDGKKDNWRKERYREDHARYQYGEDYARYGEENIKWKEQNKDFLGNLVAQVTKAVIRELDLKPQKHH